MGIQETKPGPSQQVPPQYMGQMPDIKIKSQPVAPPPCYSTTYTNPMTEYGAGPFDNPGPNVWATSQHQFQNIPQVPPQQQQQQFSNAVPQQQIGFSMRWSSRSIFCFFLIRNLFLNSLRLTTSPSAAATRSDYM